MYSIIRKIILNGSYDREDLQTKIDIFLLKDKLSSDEYNELITLMEA